MKVERKEKEVFKPITITLETEEEVQSMKIIACVERDETLTDSCKRVKDDFCFKIDVSEVDKFGRDLNDELNDFLDC